MTNTFYLLMWSLNGGGDCVPLFLSASHQEAMDNGDTVAAVFGCVRVSDFQWAEPSNQAGQKVRGYLHAITPEETKNMLHAMQMEAWMHAKPTAARGATRAAGREGDER